MDKIQRLFTRISQAPPTAGVGFPRALAYAATLSHTSERPPFPMRQALFSVIIAAGSTALALTGCGSTEPPVPTTVQIDSSSLSFSSIGETRQLTAAVKDQRGDPFRSPTITWSVTNTAVATVDGSGLVTATGMGITQVTATDESATATITVQVVQVPTQVQKVSGDGQSGPPGQELPGALTVQVNDARGHPVANIGVGFTLVGGRRRSRHPARSRARTEESRPGSHR